MQKRTYHASKPISPCYDFAYKSSIARSMESSALTRTPCARQPTPLPPPVSMPPPSHLPLPADAATPTAAGKKRGRKPGSKNVPVIPPSTAATKHPLHASDFKHQQREVACNFT